MNCIISSDSKYLSHLSAEFQWMFSCITRMKHFSSKRFDFFFIRKVRKHTYKIKSYSLLTQFPILSIPPGLKDNPTCNTFIYFPITSFPLSVHLSDSSTVDKSLLFQIFLHPISYDLKTQFFVLHYPSTILYELPSCPNHRGD